MVASPGQQQSGGEVVMDGSAPRRMSAEQCQNECRTDLRCKVLSRIFTIFIRLELKALTSTLSLYTPFYNFMISEFLMSSSESATRSRGYLKEAVSGGLGP